MTTLTPMFVWFRIMNTIAIPQVKPLCFQCNITMQLHDGLFSKQKTCDYISILKPNMMSNGSQSTVQVFSINKNQNPKIKRELRPCDT